jgi:hypothetical protein
MAKILSYWREITIALVLILMLCCFNYIVPNQPEEVKETKIVLNSNKKWEGFDSLSFGEAFNQMYSKHGSGYVFEWRGKVYLTKLRKES